MSLIAIVINIVNIQINNATNPPTVVTTIDVTNGPYAGTYVAVENSGGLQPMMAFALRPQLLLASSGETFKNGGQPFPLTDGQTYQVVNLTSTPENFCIFNETLNPRDPLLVNNPPSTQTGTPVASNFLLLQPGESFIFTLDFKTVYPDLITVVPGNVGQGAPLPPANIGLCVRFSKPAPRPSQIPKMLNSGSGRRR